MKNGLKGEKKGNEKKENWKKCNNDRKLRKKGSDRKDGEIEGWRGKDDWKSRGWEKMKFRWWRKYWISKEEKDVGGWKGGYNKGIEGEI